MEPVSIVKIANYKIVFDFINQLDITSSKDEEENHVIPHFLPKKLPQDLPMFKVIWSRLDENEKLDFWTIRLAAKTDIPRLAVEPFRWHALRRG